MSVQTQQFRVVGVNTQTGEDVSVVIDAATKAAAEVKAEKMQIETTHIVRLKQDTPEPPDEHDLFATEAAEARAGTPTDKLIEEIVPPEEPKPSAEPVSGGLNRTPEPNPASTPPTPAPQQVVAAITRPTYAAPASRQESIGAEVSGLRAFGIVLLVLFGMSAGAYFVLVHQPNSTIAHDEELIFGQDLFSDVLEPPVIESPFDKLERDAFNRRGEAPRPDGPPIALNDQLQITPGHSAEPASAGGSNNPATSSTPPEAKPAPSKSSKFKLQSVVTTNQGRFAVINGKLYEQGGNIGSAKLVSVADDWVLIERDGKQFTLQIETKQ